MIEQINVALEQKRSEISQPGSLKPAVGDCVERRHIHQLKMVKNEHPAFFPRTGRCYTLIHLITRALQSLSLRFYHFPDSDRLRVGHVTD